MGGGVGCLVTSFVEMDLFHGLGFLLQAGFSVFLANLEVLALV